MKALLWLLPGLLLLTACDGSRSPTAVSGRDRPTWNNPIYRLNPQMPGDRPLIVKQPYELEAPRSSPSEVEHENSIRLYGPGVSKRRQTLV